MNNSIRNAKSLKPSKRGIFFLHMLGCVVFICIPIFSDPRDTNPLSSLHDNHYYDEIFEYALTIVFFYINYYYLIPKFYFKKKYAVFISVALLGFIIVYMLPEMLSLSQPHKGSHPFGGPPPGFPSGPPPFERNPLARALHLHGLGPFDENFLKYAVVFILAITLKVSEKVNQIQKEKAESEIMFLKAQINPHFLFNTLNSIYTLAIEAKATSTAKAIAQLSGMMRYATSEALTAKVSLSKEIAYIDNYITLQRLRLNERVVLCYLVEGDANGKEIAPFLLIPFIENAFKHGISTDQDAHINIRIQIENDQLILEVANNKVNLTKQKEHGTSIGIKNTKQRLELLYPAKHLLVITETVTKFNVSMEISL